MKIINNIINLFKKLLSKERHPYKGVCEQCKRSGNKCDGPCPLMDMIKSDLSNRI